MVSCVDSLGNVYLSGQTSSAEFPTTLGAFQTTRGSTGSTVFVVKLSPEGNVLFSTYLSGGSSEQANAIAVDRDFNIYIGGDTLSADFPTTPGAFQRAQSNTGQLNRDGFVSKLSADGSKLIYSTYLGGSGLDSIGGLAVDSDGRVYISGRTESLDFPARGSLAQSNTGSAFLARLSKDGSALDYSFQFGGATGASYGSAVALDRTGDVYVGGATGSRDFPLIRPIQNRLADVSLYTSTDAQTWSTIAADGPFYSAATDGKQALYLGTMDGLAISRDGGKTWTRKTFRQTSTDDIGQTLWIDVNPADSNLIACVTYYRGVYLSRDGGETWRNVYRTIGSNKVVQLSSDGLRFAVGPSPVKLIASNDGGLTFRDETTAELQTLAFSYIAGRDANSPERVYVSGFYGLYRMSGQGVLQKISDVQVKLLAQLGTTMYGVGVSDSLSKSNDGGKTWNAAGQPDSGTIRSIFLFGSASQVLVGAAKGVFVSTDGGANWQSGIQGLANRNLQALLYAADTGRFYAIGSGSNDGFLVRVAGDGSKVSFSTYLGGSGFDAVSALTVLGDGGRAYIGGSSTSTDLPVTATSVQRAPADVTTGFIALIDTNASSLVAFSYVGGTGSSSAVTALALTESGEPVLAGVKYRPVDTFQQTDVLADFGSSFAFRVPSLMVLSSDLSTLRWATLLGLDGTATGISVGQNGRLIVSGTAVPDPNISWSSESSFTIPAFGGGYVTVLDLNGNSLGTSVTPSYVVHPAAGASASLQVKSSATVLTASSNVTWLSITGKTSTQVNYVVSRSESTQPRTATILVNERKVVVIQQGALGYVTLTSAPSLVPATGGSVSITVTASATDYAWTATVVQGWITIQSGIGVGSGQTVLLVDRNLTTAARMAEVRVGGQSITITQAGAAAPVGLRFVPITPCRLADTREADIVNGSTLAANTARDFLVKGNRCGVPIDASAFALNVTAVPKGPLGFLTIWPYGQTRPFVSLLNSDGRVKSNAAIVTAESSWVSVYVTHETDVILDITGYFVPFTGMLFHTVAPCRVADTRVASPIGAGQSRTFPVAGTCGVPASAKAFSLNVTAVPREPLGYLTIWPAGTAKPFVSTLNSWNGGIVANAAIVLGGTTNGAIEVFVTNPSDVVLDVNGYFDTVEPGGLSLYSTAPCRMADTRSTTMMQGGETRSFSYAGSGCQPAGTAQALVLNATVVPKGALSYLTLGPAEQPLALVSTLNSPDASITSNLAIVPSTLVKAFVPQASDLILDVSAFFAP